MSKTELFLSLTALAILIGLVGYVMSELPSQAEIKTVIEQIHGVSK